MDLRKFFNELKRRYVYRAAVLYGMGAWLLAQIATQIFPFFEIPNWAVRLVVLLLIAGFPVALVFSWAFQITQEGIKRESEVEADKSIAHHTGRKIVALTVLLAVIAAALFAFQYVRSKAHSRVEGGAPATPNTSASPARTGLAGARPSIPEKSIAVLPFDNLGGIRSETIRASRKSYKVPNRR